MGERDIGAGGGEETIILILSFKEKVVPNPRLFLAPWKEWRNTWKGGYEQFTD